MKKRNLLSVIIGTGIMMFSLAGCGNEAPAPEAVTGDTAAGEEAAAENTAGEEADSVSGDEGDIVGVQGTIDMYQDFVDGLESGQAYAYASIAGEYDALLVTDYVYDYDGNGLLTGIGATIYCTDKDGNIKEYGNVTSAGTAYPLAVFDDKYLMYGDNHSMNKVYVDVENGSMMTKEYASEVLNDDGSSSYFYMSLDDEFDGEVENGDKLSAMYADKENAVLIYFTVVE